MKRILTIICAIAFSGAVLSAQDDTIKVSRDGADTLVIILKDRQSIDRQARKEQRLAEKAHMSAYMINAGYDRGYRAVIELSWADKSVWGITSSHGFSFGIGLECIILRSRICRHQVFVHEDSCKPIRQPQGRSNRRYNKPWCQNICQSGSGSLYRKILIEGRI